ncbi:MAG TPA: hypothetical protein PLE45_09655 [Spirochaetota bacterium]|nr:hypothetical protein [Spirochaetota bacterium]HOL57459.1 hypothetical protein [Spirochaetota bacterium]HPP04382.1 hypothetical protein [Spirochaetota bacterium]
MRKILLFFILLILVSCETTDIVIVNPIDDDSKKLIEETELLLLEYKRTFNKEFLKRSYEIISNLMKKANNNKYFEAKVLGLKGEYELAQGNKNIKGIIEDIERKNKNEEKLYIIKAHLEDDIAKKEEILNVGIKNANTNERIKLFLADLYFLKGEYIKATSLYDEVLPILPEGYKKNYEKRRGISRVFIKNPPKDFKSGFIVEKDKITFDDVIKLTDMETDLLKEYRNLKDFELKEKLFNDKFIFDKNINISDYIKRKDVVYFLLKVVSLVDRDPSLLTKYSKSIEKIKKSDIEEKDLSPIPDVKMVDYFYTAVLVLVEREIIDLPDGTNFMPEEFISGLEYYSTLKKCR